MRRRIMAFIMACAMIMTFPIAGSAEELSESEVEVGEIALEEGTNVESISQNEQQLSRDARSSRTRTVTDKHGNRYTVTGTALKSGTIGIVATAFSASYYYTGQNKNQVREYSKNCVANMSVNLQGGGANSFNRSQSMKGLSGECKDTQSFYYQVTYVVGNHYFSCENGSTSFQSAE